ncbi:MAG TPA: hypothetical protein VEJ63_20160, partial [Planctomycetota bacterium]|nr:hypothetical protein [Planctomycetota bacterium]
LNYCLKMPGAVRLELNAGDLCLYRNCMWHLGNYLPYKRRATLHDFVDTPAYQRFRVEFPAKARTLTETATAPV